MDLKDKKVLVIGMAKSGISAAKLCNKVGAVVTIYDNKPRTELDLIAKELEDLDIKCLFNQDIKLIIEKQDLLILSPGVPTDLDFINHAKDLSIPVWSEIELAYTFCKSSIIGITGTNGKTTTTSMVGEIVKKYKSDSFVVGNIGFPFSDYTLKTNKQSYIIAELSSFQLETINKFHPKISAILNLTPDHLNRHKTYDRYIAAKENVFINQNSNDYCVLNFDDQMCTKIANKIKSKIVYFSRQNKLNDGVFIEKDNIIIKTKAKKINICNIHDLQIVGSHNIENTLAAVAISYCANIPANIIRQQVLNFQGVEHRVEYVTSINGVKYYNDSKATNIDAAIKGLDAMKCPTVLIGGGMDKGIPFDDWIKNFEGKVKKLIVFGETAEKIINTANKFNYSNIIKVNNLEEAVICAYKIANNGDCVLLSPACASWDMFSSYEERGELFKKLVMQLKE